MRKVLNYILLSALVLVLQTTIVRFLAIETVVPDVVLLWIVFLAVREGQPVATVAGFLLGLCLDLLSGGDGMLGLGALSKTLTGFLAGYSYNVPRTYLILGSYRFALLTLAVSLVQNSMYFVIFLQGSDAGWVNAILLYGVPASLYTTALTVIPVLIFSRRGRVQV